MSTITPKSLNEYLSDPQPGYLTAAQLMVALGIKNVAQLRQWQHGYADRIPSPQTCVAIERATDGVVTRPKLRPNDWWLIWPELVTSEHPAPETTTERAA